MKRKVLVTMLCLAIFVSVVAFVIKNTAGQKVKEETTSVATEETTEEQEKDTSDNGIPESKLWPDYKRTMDYYVGHGLLDMTAAKLQNPDAYGNELAGQVAMETDVGSGSPSLGIYLKSVDLTTTKGFKITAYWYTETNTVQYIYCGEALAGSGWYSPMESMEYLMDHGSVINSLDMTHQERMDLLGKPALTDKEVIQIASNGKIDYMKRLIITTTKGYNIQAFWNMKDNTVEYVYAGDTDPFGSRSSFLQTADALAVVGEYSGTREKKIEILGEPAVSPEEVVKVLSKLPDEQFSTTYEEK